VDAFLYFSQMDYLQKNKDYWNGRVESHAESEFYGMEQFMAGGSSLKSIELSFLPEDLSGLKILHLQCHFGQDSLSLARMGAEVTGVDLSNDAISKARELNKELGLNAKFVNCDVYDSPNHIQEEFDIVFTSYGTIGWLPDLDKWAHVVNHFLKPGGQFLIVDFHPTLWMFDDDFTHAKYSYFNVGPIEEIQEGTYTDKGDQIKAEFIGWNHDTAELLTALLNQGLVINSFSEYDYSPWPCFENIIRTENGWQIKGMEGKLPMVFALQCEKNK